MLAVTHYQAIFPLIWTNNSSNSTRIALRTRREGDHKISYTATGRRRLGRSGNRGPATKLKRNVRKAHSTRLDISSDCFEFLAVLSRRFAESIPLNARFLGKSFRAAIRHATL
jgi:hypothetical protein